MPQACRSCYDCVNASPTSGWKERVRAEFLRSFYPAIYPEGSVCRVRSLPALDAFEARGHRHLEQAGRDAVVSMDMLGQFEGSADPLSSGIARSGRCLRENGRCAVFLGLCGRIAATPRDRRTIRASGRGFAEPFACPRRLRSGLIGAGKFEQAAEFLEQTARVLRSDPELDFYRAKHFVNCVGWGRRRKLMSGRSRTFVENPSARCSCPT